MIEKLKNILKEKTSFKRIVLKCIFPRLNDNAYCTEGNFKVHKYFLKRDSEVFEGMFTVPVGEGSVEGKTGDAPITLPGFQARADSATTKQKRQETQVVQRNYSKKFSARPSGAL